MSTNKEKANWLAGLLSGWGIKESWAKIIAGALIGALAAAGILTQTGCAVDITRAADGSLSLRGSVIQPVTVQEGK